VRARQFGVPAGSPIFRSDDCGTALRARLDTSGEPVQDDPDKPGNQRRNPCSLNAHDGWGWSRWLESHWSCAPSPPSADPKTEGAAVIGQGTYGNSGDFTINAEAEKFSTVGHGTLEIVGTIARSMVRSRVSSLTATEMLPAAAVLGQGQRSRLRLRRERLGYSRRLLRGPVDHRSACRRSMPTFGFAAGPSFDEWRSCDLQVFPGHKLKT